MESRELDHAILKTITHFDVLNYPLTFLEILNFLEIKTTAVELKKALVTEPLRSLLANHQGWYYLKGREETVGIRQKRYRLYLKKIKRAKKIAQLFFLFPWIRAVAIYGSLALKNSSALGDIDLFIITAPDRVWSTRFFINTFLKLLNLRPTSQTAKNKICVSYWADENNLDLSIVNLPSDHYYYYYGAGSFIFLTDAKNLQQKFFSANRWLRDKLPNVLMPEPANIYKPGPIILKIQKIKEAACELVGEATYRTWQEKILPQKYRLANDGKRVVLSDGLIKLHDNDKRQKFNVLFDENFKRALSNYEH